VTSLRGPGRGRPSGWRPRARDLPTAQADPRLFPSAAAPRSRSCRGRGWRIEPRPTCGWDSHRSSACGPAGPPGAVRPLWPQPLPRPNRHQESTSADAAGALAPRRGRAPAREPAAPPGGPRAGCLALGTGPGAPVRSAPRQRLDGNGRPRSRLGRRSASARRTGRTSSFSADGLTGLVQASARRPRRRVNHSLTPAPQWLTRGMGGPGWSRSPTRWPSRGSRRGS
jgi:hypothetical protein